MELIEAIKEEDIEAVKQAIAAGADVNAKGKDGRTLLHDAAQDGHKEIAELLIAKGADVNARDDDEETSLHWVVRGRSKEIIGLLIAAGADVNAKDKDGWTPLHYATDEGLKGIIGLLMEHGADVNAKHDGGGKTPLHQTGSAVIADLLITKGADVNAEEDDGTTPLHNAARGDYSEIAELLIDAGADVNVMTEEYGTLLDKAINWDAGNTDECETGDYLRLHGAKTSEEINTLFDAVENEDFEAVKQAIADDIDVNARNEHGAPLHRAVYNGHKEIVELLIDKGADVNAKDENGHTPLRGASNKEIVELLIANGADYEAKDRDGMTPFIYAAAYGSSEIAELLIAKGADVNAKTNNGHTPLDWAIDEGNIESVDFLRKHGGKSGAEDSIHVAAAVGNIEAVKQHLDAGTDMNVKNEYGTPLHYATWNGQKEIAELLIAKGAEVNAKDAEGKTPLDEAIEYNKTKTADLLREHGGKTGDELNADRVKKRNLAPANRRLSQSHYIVINAMRSCGNGMVNTDVGLVDTHQNSRNNFNA